MAESTLRAMVLEKLKPLYKSIDTLDINTVLQKVSEDGGYRSKLTTYHKPAFEPLAALEEASCASSAEEPDEIVLLAVEPPLATVTPVAATEVVSPSEDALVMRAEQSSAQQILVSLDEGADVGKAESEKKTSKSKKREKRPFPKKKKVMVGSLVAGVLLCGGLVLYTTGGIPLFAQALADSSTPKSTLSVPQKATTQEKTYKYSVLGPSQIEAEATEVAEFSEAGYLRQSTIETTWPDAEIAQAAFDEMKADFGTLLLEGSIEDEVVIVVVSPGEKRIEEPSYTQLLLRTAADCEVVS